MSVLTVAVILVGCAAKTKPALPTHHVDVLVLKGTDVPYEFDYPASISGVADFQVVPRINGVLFKQLYKEGAFVKKDNPLYEIDPRPFQNQLLADKGQLLRDQTASIEYKAILDRYEKLYKIGGVSKQDVQTATINYKQALGNTQVDLANIKNDNLNLEYCTVRSPIDGLISERLVTIGTMVTAYQTVLNNINSQSNMYVNFSIPENDRLEIQTGITSGKVYVPQNYMFNVNLELADGSMIKKAGTVNFFDTRISLQNGTWNMRADVNNAAINNKLLSGQYVHVYLTGAVFKNAIAIPQSAVFRDDKNPFVYLVDKDGKVEKIVVITGVMNGSNWVIDSGLKDEDRLIVNGGMKVAALDKVIIDSTKTQ